jgi:hypothetical protein
MTWETGREVPALRLRPGTPVLDRGDGEVQLGTDPRWALVVGGLSEAEVAWLCEGASRRHVSLDRAARRFAVTDARRAEIMRLLARCGYLVPPVPRSPGGTTAPADGAADASTLAALRPDGAGGVTLAERARRTVGISGLGRLGAALALHLATAGIGTLVLDDRSPVQTTDTGLGGYRQGDIGAPRERALGDVLAERHPRTAVVHELDGEPDAVVVVEADVVQPERYARLLGVAVPHLPVVVREADVVLGPLVLPGRSACVGCWARHATDEDARWPWLARALRERPDDRAQETTLAALAAALAGGQVLALLDGARPVAVGATLEVALPEALPRVRPVQPHAGCGCTGLAPVG